MINATHKAGVNPLKIMVFLDGRPGHEKQTKSVLTAISRITPMHVIFNNIRPGGLLKGVMDWLRYVVWYLSPFRARPEGRPVDLIMGAGAFTHIPMILYKKRGGGKTVTCMSPAYPLIREFDLCLVPRHDNKPAADNIFPTIGPPMCPSLHGEHDPQKGLILVGGVDKRSHQWHSDILLEQIQYILSRETDMAWTVSSSPRTPGETLSALEKLAMSHENCSFFRSQDTPAGWVEQQYGINDVVWVTADSISMIFESLTAGCRVGVLPVEWKHSQNKFEKSIDYLIQNGWVISYEGWHAGAKSEVKKAPLDEADRCAKEILQRWWPDRLQ